MLKGAGGGGGGVRASVRVRVRVGGGGEQVCFVSFQQITFTLGNIISSKAIFPEKSTDLP